MREDVRAVAPKNDTVVNQQEWVSSATRLDAAEKNMTALPSPLMEGSVLASLACAPALSTLTRWVVPVSRSRTNTSGQVPEVLYT